MQRLLVVLLIVCINTIGIYYASLTLLPQIINEIQIHKELSIHSIGFILGLLVIYRLNSAVQFLDPDAYETEADFTADQNMEYAIHIVVCIVALVLYNAILYFG